MEKKFYEMNWFNILMLIVFFPIGLYTMWKYTNWNKKIKIVISVIWAVVIIMLLSGSTLEDTIPPDLVTKEEITFQLEEEISEDTIIEEAVDKVSDDITKEENIKLYIENYEAISNQITSQNNLQVCAKDESENEVCNGVVVIVDDSEQKAQEKLEAEQAKEDQEAKEAQEAKEEKEAQEAQAELEAKEAQEAQAEIEAQEAQAELEAQEAQAAQQAQEANTASALCKDGTYSYSEHRSGTCSHHGGVAEWYKDLP